MYRTASRKGLRLRRSGRNSIIGRVRCRPFRGTLKPREGEKRERKETKKKRVAEDGPRGGETSVVEEVSLKERGPRRRVDWANYNFPIKSVPSLRRGDASSSNEPRTSTTEAIKRDRESTSRREILLSPTLLSALFLENFALLA